MSKLLFNATHNLESANDLTKHWSFLTVRSSLQLGDITFKEEENIKDFQVKTASLYLYKSTAINYLNIRTAGLQSLQSSLTH